MPDEPATPPPTRVEGRISRLLCRLGLHDDDGEVRREGCVSIRWCPRCRREYRMEPFSGR